MNMKITRLKTSQLEKEFRKKNLDIKERFKIAFFYTVERENLWVCQIEVKPAS